MEEFVKDFRDRHVTLRVIVLTVVIACVIISGASIGFAYKIHQDSLNSIWVAQDGKVYHTVRRNNQYNYPERPLEYKQAIKEFHLLRYSADRYSYQNNIAQAIEYCSHNIQEDILNSYYDDDIEKNVTEKGWTYQSYVDSVYLAPPTYRKGYIWGKQSIRMKNRTIRRNMHLQFTVSDISRSDGNPLGVILDEIEIFNNQLISE